MRYIYGRKPVLEAIHAENEIEVVYIQYGLKGGIIDKIKHYAKKAGVKVNEVPTKKFASMENADSSQGVIASISDITYLSLGELLGKISSKTDPLLLLLDSIQDPHNLGAILRTAECTGVDGVIITSNKSASITETAVKTSAGAVSFLNICKVNNLVNAMKGLKDGGYWITGTQLGGDKNYTEIDYSGKTAIVMGNEEKGIRKLVAENCDYLAEIPMKGNVQSLNVSVATGVVLFEILKQRA